MINVSREFLELMRERTDFIPSADITLADGTILAVTVADMVNGENGLTDAANADGLPIGQAICRTIILTLDNSRDQYEDVDFFGAEVNAKISFRLSNSTETINCGLFTVTTPEEYGAAVTITAEDAMHRANKPFTTTLAVPVTAGALLRDICSICHIPLASVSFRNDDFVITALPDKETTFRQVIGYIACIAIGNARINRNGRLEIVEYDLSFVGGCDQEDLSTADAVINTGTEKVIVLRDWINSPNYYASEVQITGISVSAAGSEEDTELVGADTYVLAIENPLATGKETLLAQRIAAVLTGVSFLPFSGDYISLPIAELMDPVVMLDRRGGIHYSILTDINYDFLGVTTLSNSATSSYRSNARYVNKANKSYQKAREMIMDLRMTYDEEYENLEWRIRNAPGYYKTEEVQQDGSVIEYFHNKPTLAESMIIWRKAGDVRSVSTDGGNTWNAAMTADGDAILRLLTVVGINADWINAGSVDADYIDAKGLRVLDNNQNITFYIDDNGQVQLNVSSLAITGKNIAEYLKEGNNLLKSPFDLTASEYWIWMGTLTGGQADPDGGTNAIRMKRTSATGDEANFSSSSTNLPFKSGGQNYRFSVWLKAEEATTIKIIMNHAITHDITLTTSWQRYTVEDYVATPAESYHVTIGAWHSWVTTGYIYIYNPVVEYADPYMSQQAIFNQLTNNGVEQGIYLQNGKIYINGTYLQAGTVSGDMINAKGLKVKNNNDLLTFYVDQNGNVQLIASSLYVGGVPAASTDDVDDSLANAKDYADKILAMSKEYTDNNGNLLESPIELSTDYWVYAGTRQTGHIDPEGGNKAIALVANGGDCYYSTKPSTNTPIKSKGQNYVFSVWLKANTTIPDFCLTLNHTNYGKQERVTLDWHWQKFSVECKVDTITDLNQVVIGGFGSFTTNGNTIYIYNPSVQYASPYPDQEAIMAALTNNFVDDGLYLVNDKVYLNGTYLRADSVSADAMSVTDLYAIGATIGGFGINSSSIYSQKTVGSNTYKDIEIVKGTSNADSKITVRDSLGYALTLSGKTLKSSSPSRVTLDAEATLSSDTISSGVKNYLGSTQVGGDFAVSGTKSAVRPTQDYGQQTYYCYEMPSPYFGDIGDGTIDADGTCYVSLDSIFTESTSMKLQYFVFLQKRSEGDCWVDERYPEYFVVRGTPGLAFSWEVKGKQTGYEDIRFNNEATEGRVVDFSVTDYEEQSAEMVIQVMAEEEEMYE